MQRPAVKDLDHRIVERRPQHAQEIPRGQSSPAHCSYRLESITPLVGGVQSQQQNWPFLGRALVRVRNARHPEVTGRDHRTSPRPQAHSR